MKTLAIAIALNGKITVPDSVIKDLRFEASAAAANPELTDGHDKYAAEMHVKFPDDDEAFVQALLKNALRSIIRNGFVEDVRGMGCGIKLAPAEVEVSMPERIITKVKGREQINAEDVQGADSVETIRPAA